MDLNVLSSTFTQVIRYNIEVNNAYIYVYRIMKNHAFMKKVIFMRESVQEVYKYSHSDEVIIG